MADGPFQPFTADPSSAGTESAVGRMGGKRSVEVRGRAGSPGRKQTVKARHRSRGNSR